MWDKVWLKTWGHVWGKVRGKVWGKVRGLTDSTVSVADGEEVCALDLAKEVKSKIASLEVAIGRISSLDGHGEPGGEGGGLSDVYAGVSARETLRKIGAVAAGLGGVNLP